MMAVLCELKSHFYGLVLCSLILPICMYVRTDVRTYVNELGVCTYVCTYICLYSVSILNICIGTKKAQMETVHHVQRNLMLLSDL